MSKPKTSTKPPEHLIGYARVSTEEQSYEMQVAALKRAGVADDDIYSDKKSGATMDKRDGLSMALKACRSPEDNRPGSVLVVYKLDRVSRSMSDMVRLFDELNERGVELRSVTESIDTRTPGGFLLFGIMIVMAEFERRLTLERTHSGLASARAQGRVGGAKRQFTPEKEEEIARAFWAKPKNRSDNQQAILLSKRYGITTQAVRNYRDDNPQAKPAGVAPPNTQRYRRAVAKLKEKRK